MEFGVLGPLVVERTGRLVPIAGGRERCLLGVLLLSAGRVVATERLVDLLWDDRPPVRAEAALHTHVSRLRRALTPGDGGEPAHVVRRGRGYAIDVDEAAIDLYRFDTLVDQARECADAEGQWRGLRSALALWRGPLLADVGTPGFRARLSAGIDERRMAALRLRLDADLALDRHRQIVGELTDLCAEHPLDEELASRLITALHRSGRRHDALAAYHDIRTRLRDGLGLDPADELQALQATLLRGEVGPGPAGEPHNMADGRTHSTPPTTPAQLPADIRGFAGRDHQLRKLDDLISAEPPASVPIVVAVVGSPGIGKSCLALHWAHAAASRFPNGQLFVNLRGFGPSSAPMSTMEALGGFLEALDVPPDRMPATLQARTGLYRSLLADRRVLVVLDNARDAEQIRPLLPGSAGSATIVTSRDQLSGLVALDCAEKLDLAPFTSAEALWLLRRRLGAARVTAHPAAVDEIIIRCAGLPLALAIVSAHAVDRPDFPLSALADQLHETAGSLVAFAGTGGSADVRIVFSWSYRALGGDSPRLFRLLGLHPGPDFTASAAASLAGVSTEQARQALDELCRAHLVIEQVPGRYLLHDLLRAYASELVHSVDAAADRDAALQRLFDHYLCTGIAAALRIRPHRDPIAAEAPQPRVTLPELPDHDTAHRWFADEYPVIMAGVELAAATGNEMYSWKLAWTLTTFLHQSGRGPELAAVDHVGLAAAERIGDSGGQAHMNYGLGLAAYALGQYDDALAHYRRALDICEPLRARLRAHLHLDIGGVLDRQGRHREAIDHVHQASTLCLTEGDNAGQARALGDLG